MRKDTRMGDSCLFAQFADPKGLNLSKEINTHVFPSITDTLQKVKTRIDIQSNNRGKIRMEKKEGMKRQVSMYAILFLGSVSFISMLYSLNDARYFNISLAILIFTLTCFMVNVLYLLSESNK